MITVPGAKEYYKTIVQPVIEREHVNVQVQESPDRIVNNRAVREAARVRNKVNRKVVNVPGRTITHQAHIQPIVNTIRTNLKVLRSPIQRITNRPIIKKPVVTRSKKTVNHTFVHEVPIERVVHVPSPVLYRIPVFLGTKTAMIQDAGSNLAGVNISGATADAEAALLLKGGLLNRGFGSLQEKLAGDMMIAEGAAELEVKAKLQAAAAAKLRMGALADA